MESEFRKTIERAKANGVSYIWSGDMRGKYLRECLAFAEKNGLVKLTFTEMDQESGYLTEWT